MIIDRSIFLILLSFNTLIVYAQQDTFELEPSQDNTLYEDPQGDLSNGIGRSLFIGQTGPDGDNELRRAVLNFDLSPIQAGRQVLSASLSVTVSMVPPVAESFNGNLHRLLADWGEGNSEAGFVGGQGTAAETGDATWLHTFFPDSFWVTAGGDFLAAPSATQAFGTAVETVTFSSQQLADDVQDMLDIPADNFGWIILGDEGTPGNARRLASRENGTVSDRPLLIINLVSETVFSDGFESLE